MKKRDLIILILIIGLLGVLFYFLNEKINDTLVECYSDSDCVANSCCHASSCVSKSLKPNCSDIFCTMNCQSDTMDCGQGSCGCVKGKCIVNWGEK
ncbi:MAG TPA: hypothetical protein HA283_01770 [Nanoarchaeota archaeon]|nr:hypothetical protein [Nanoarchaeota archaeon]HIH63002.1 hypothetical protein [Nanoarchaeota archaeon]HIJ10267.1 hypothetical protein [Nanoarchaeota archaeon]